MKRARSPKTRVSVVAAGHAALTVASAATGAGLGAVFGLAAILRRDKPLHPVGAVAGARLVVTPAAAAPCGSPLLDEPGEYECVVRASHAAGTGPERPDIEGLALRILAPATAEVLADVLFASTGVGRLSRHVLAVRRPGRHAALTTLLPVRSPSAPLYLRADPLDPGSRPWPAAYRILWAHGLGQWQPAATLTVTWGEPQDAPERFDPVQFPLPGTTQYAPITALREPAYLLARRAWPRAGQLPPR